MSNNKKGINPVAVGIAGAVIGAAVGAAAIALSDEGNREKLDQTVKDLKSKGGDIFEEIKEKTNEALDQIEAQAEKLDKKD